ncbi:uncharacterized protein LOC101856225 [Aplysia californica]|uniref:Uncharacterized protein LOC101856225 n=1 Tax=Aplysia californica TaxID=6500 RepID=A0ABM0K821_APLCA|nr:uncharacterized protein LOC101856225 [Aplysia californica]XP_005111005.1 uncharacterized protein LOC101856225 [Aplysia californica]
MGIPDEMEGPPRKRSRLSLRALRTKDVPESAQDSHDVDLLQDSSGFTEPTMSSMPPQSEGNETSSEDLLLVPDCSPVSKECLVPPVASLYNLGNTCFMNCMLQVLRYTPGFVPALRQLQEEIVLEEIRTASESADPDDISEAIDVEPKAVWQFVKNAHQLFVDMEWTEDQYTDLATGDGVSMSVRPTALLSSIQSLNPMFEGHFQHDAQELLRCLLCYVEDAERELRLIRSRRKEEEEEKKKQESRQSDGGVGKTADSAAQDESEKDTLRCAKTGVRSELTGKPERLESDGETLRGGDCNDGARGRGRVRGGRGRPRKAGSSSSLMASSAFMETFLRCKTLKSGASVSGLPDSSSCCREGGKVEMDACDGGTVDGLQQSEAVKSSILKCDEVVTASGDLKGDSAHTSVEVEKKRATKGSCKKQEKSDAGKRENCDLEVSSKSRKRKRSISPGLKSESTVVRGDGSCPTCGLSKSGKKGRGRRRSKGKAKTEVCSCANTSAMVSEGDDKNVLDSAGADLSEKLEKCPGDVRVDENSIPTADKSESFLQKIQRKFQFPFSSTKGETSTSSGSRGLVGTKIESGSSQQRSILSMFPLGQVKRLGIRGRATVRGSDISKGNIESVSSQPPSLSAVKEEPNCGSESSIVGETSKCLSWNADKSSGPPISNATNCSDSSFSTVTNGDSSQCEAGSSRVSSSSSSCLRSPKLTPQKSDVVLRSSMCLTPRSPMSVAHCDEISPAPRGCVSSAASPIRSGISPPSTPRRRNLTKEFLSCSPTAKREEQTACYSTLATSPLPGSDITVHSPSKMGGLRAVKMELAKAKVSSSDSSSLGPLTVSTTFTTLPTRVSWPTPPTSRSSRYCSSAPNSPDHMATSPPVLSSSLFEERPQLTSAVHHKSGKASQGSLKLEVRKCDWLGVSPVKSISAQRALAVMRSESPKNLKTRPLKCSAVRKICYDEPILPSETNQKGKLTDECKEVGGSMLSGQKSGKFKTLSKSVEKLNQSGAVVAVPEAVDCPSSASAEPSAVPTLKTRRNKNPKKCHSGSSTDKKSSKLSSVSVSLQRCDWLLSDAKRETASMKMLLRGNKCKLSQGNSGSELSESKASPNRSCGNQIQSKNDLLSSSSSLLSSSVTVAEQLFAGSMVHCTRCLDCENTSDRQEAFMDISVPVRGDNPGDDDSDDEDNGGKTENENSSTSVSCLSRLVQAFSSVERLRDSNKYWCETCAHYTEAERSSRYTTLPAVLTLQLKRFSANSGLFGGVSKLNDRVGIPQILPCLHHNCQENCSQPAHQYSLFAVVTHSGLSILHGHYRAYVRVQPGVSPRVLRGLHRATVKEESETKDVFSEEKVETHRFSREKISQHADWLCSQNDSVSLVVEDDSSQSNRRRSLTKSSGDDDDGSLSGGDMSCLWLECDDECVRVLEEDEFESRLNETDGALMGTPYVLFYHKLVTV